MKVTSTICSNKYFGVIRITNRSRTDWGLYSSENSGFFKNRIHNDKIENENWEIMQIFKYQKQMESKQILFFPEYFIQIVSPWWSSTAEHRWD
jgi:hypothetical protein